MAHQTEAQKRAQKNYIKKFSRVEVRMTHEKQALVQSHAELQGESVNGFINRAIDETAQRDNGVKVTEPAQTFSECAALSQARKESIARHVAKLDQIKIQPYREEGAAIRDSAAEAGQSVQAYVLQAVRERIKRDKNHAPVDTGDAATRGAFPSVGLPFPTGMPGQSVRLVLQALREDSFRAALEVCGKTGENVSDFIDRAIWKAIEQAME